MLEGTALPRLDPEQIEDIVNMINDMGITVHEKAPDAESLVLSDAAVNDDEAVEEAAAGENASIPLGRPAEPEEIAAAVAFLAGFTTGRGTDEGPAVKSVHLLNLPDGITEADIRLFTEMGVQTGDVLFETTEATGSLDLQPGTYYVMADTWPSPTSTTATTASSRWGRAPSQRSQSSVSGGGGVSCGRRSPLIIYLLGLGRSHQAITSLTSPMAPSRIIFATPR